MNRLTCLALTCFAATPLCAQMNVDFEGGSLASLLDKIRAETSYNLIGSKMASDVEIPPLQIKEASLMSTLRAVAAISPTDYQVVVDEHRDDANKSVYTVKVFHSGQTGPRPSIQSRTVLFSLQNMTRRPQSVPEREGMTLTVESILNAVDAALGVADDGTKAKLQYHEDSDLLFIRGTNNQIGLVSNVLETLENNIDAVRLDAIRSAVKKER